MHAQVSIIRHKQAATRKKKNDWRCFYVEHNRQKIIYNENKTIEGHGTQKKSTRGKLFFFLPFYCYCNSKFRFCVPDMAFHEEYFIIFIVSWHVSNSQLAFAICTQLVLQQFNGTSGTHLMMTKKKKEISFSSDQWNGNETRQQTKWIRDGMECEWEWDHQTHLRLKCWCWH